MNVQEWTRKGVLGVAFAGILAAGAYAQDVQNDKQDIRADRRDLRQDRTDHPGHAEGEFS